MEIALRWFYQGEEMVVRIAHVHDGIEPHKILHAKHKAIQCVALVGQELLLHTLHIIATERIVVVEIAGDDKLFVVAEHRPNSAPDETTIGCLLVTKKFDRLIGAEEAGAKLWHHGLIADDALAHDCRRIFVEEAKPCEIAVGLASHRRQAESFEQVEPLLQPVVGLRGPVALILIPNLKVEECYDEMFEFGLLVFHDGRFL